MKFIIFAVIAVIILSGCGDKESPEKSPSDVLIDDTQLESKEKILPDERVDIVKDNDIKTDMSTDMSDQALPEEDVSGLVDDSTREDEYTDIYKEDKIPSEKIQDAIDVMNGDSYPSSEAKPVNPDLIKGAEAIDQEVYETDGY